MPQDFGNSQEGVYASQAGEELLHDVPHRLRAPVQHPADVIQPLLIEGKALLDKRPVIVNGLAVSGKDEADVHLRHPPQAGPILHQRTATRRILPLRRFDDSVGTDVLDEMVAAQEQPRLALVEADEASSMAGGVKYFPGRLPLAKGIAFIQQVFHLHGGAVAVHVAEATCHSQLSRQRHSRGAHQASVPAQTPSAGFPLAQTGRAGGMG